MHMYLIKRYLSFSILPIKVDCPGGNTSWDRVDVKNSTRHCQGQRNACNQTGQMCKSSTLSDPPFSHCCSLDLRFYRCLFVILTLALDCPENSMCMPYGPGFVQCGCTHSFHGYKCLREVRNSAWGSPSVLTTKQWQSVTETVHKTGGKNRAMLMFLLWTAGPLSYAGSPGNIGRIHNCCFTVTMDYAKAKNKRRPSSCVIWQLVGKTEQNALCQWCIWIQKSFVLFFFCRELGRFGNVSFRCGSLPQSCLAK